MIKLKKLLKENEEQHKKFGTDTKKSFLEIVSTYNKYQEMMDRKSDITKIAETLSAITDAAQQLAINEEDEWFDKHTVKRNMGDLNKMGAQFSKIAKESAQLDQRMTGLYEDMGHILSRYYKIGEITEDEMKSRLGINEDLISTWKNKLGGSAEVLKIHGNFVLKFNSRSGAVSKADIILDTEKEVAVELKKQGYTKLKESKLNEGADHILLQSIDMMIDSYRGHLIDKDYSNMGNDVFFGTPEWKKITKKANPKDKKIIASVIKNMNESTIKEAAGYRLKARDKQIIDAFVNGYFKNAQSLYKNGAYSVEKIKDGWKLTGIGGTYSAWIDDTLYYGQAYGNISQTLINFIRKTAKQRGINAEYKNLQNT